MREILPQNPKKHNPLVVIGLLGCLVLVGTAGFASGILYSNNSRREPVRIIQQAGTAPQATSSEAVVVTIEPEKAGKLVDPEVVASKNGTKYYFPWCSGATRLSEKTKITFKNAEEAKRAGYEPASNCKGVQ